MRVFERAAKNLRRNSTAPTLQSATIAVHEGGLLTDKVYRAFAPFPAVGRPLARVMRRLPHRVRTVQHRGAGLSIDPSEMSGFYLYYERDYDTEIFDFIERVIARYALVIDIGANIGVYTCYFSARVPRVVAFEPDPVVFTWLERNLKLNSCKNVEVHQSCIGQASGSVEFFCGDSRNNGLGSMIDAPGECIVRPCMCLDDIFHDPLQHCLIKMDVEGAEWMVLQGARGLLAAPNGSVEILLEIHPDQLNKMGVSLADLRGLLSELGYNTWAIRHHGLAPMPADAGAERFWWASRGDAVMRSSSMQRP